MKPPACFENMEARRHIEKLCSQENIDLDLLKDLCEVIQEYAGYGRKDGVVSELTDCIQRFLDRHPE